MQGSTPPAPEVEWVDARKKLDAKQRAHVADLYRSRKHTVEEIRPIGGRIESDGLRVRERGTAGGMKVPADLGVWRT